MTGEARGDRPEGRGRPTRKGGTLSPREHGAWAQVGAPQLTAMAAGGALGLAGWFWWIAVTAAFLAHEPLLVLLGQRGARVKRQLEEAARRRIGQLLMVAAAGGAGFWFLAEGPDRWSAAPALLLVAAVLPFVWKGKEKTLAGELIVGLAFAAAAAPALVAAGRPQAALLAAGTWALIFTLATITVRAVVAQQRATDVVRGRWVAGTLAVVVLVVGLALGQGRVLPRPAVLAPMPLAIVALQMALRPPPATQLKKVGWALAACFTLGTALLIAGLVVL